MIKSFDTPSLQSVGEGGGSASSGSSNLVLWLVVGAVAVYLGYTYIYVPMRDAKKKEEAQKVGA